MGGLSGPRKEGRKTHKSPVLNWQISCPILLSCFGKWVSGKHSGLSIVNLFSRKRSNKDFSRSLLPWKRHVNVRLYFLNLGLDGIRISILSASWNLFQIQPILSRVCICLPAKPRHAAGRCRWVRGRERARSYLL